MTKIILAAMLVFGFSTFAEDHGTDAATHTETEGMPAEGHDAAMGHDQKAPEGKKMAKKGAMKDMKDMKKKDKKPAHAH